MPAFPVTLTWPWLGPLGLLPLPVKYRIYFGEPMRFDGNPNDEDEVIGEKVEQVKAAHRRRCSRTGLASAALALLVAAAMRLETRVRPGDPEFRANAAHMARLVADAARRARARRAPAARPRRARATPRAASCCVRERVERLLDPGTPFLELSPLAAHGCYDDDAPGRRHRHRHRHASRAARR